MNHYKEFIISADPFIPDILSSFLWELNIDGINEDVNCIRVFASEESDVTVESISSMLNKIKDENLIRNFTIEEFLQEKKNWNKEWEESLNIIHVSDRIVIKPTFKDYDKKENELVITIDPKMSFGTGEHQTTRLILQVLDKYLPKKGKVLDVGTGTGVLAIASVLLSDVTTLGVDIDEWSYNNALENIKLNNVEDKIEIIQGVITDIDEVNYELVLANIQKNILIEIADEIYIRTANDGYTILSGLLYIDEEDIVNRYTSVGFSFVEKQQLDDWISIVFRK